MGKKLVIGITAAGSVNLLRGQISYFNNIGYKIWLLAPDNELTRSFCKEEGCTLLPVKVDREISLFSDLASLFAIIRHFSTIRPDIVNVGTPKVGLLGIMAAKFCCVKKRIYTCRGLRFEHEKGLKRKILKVTEWLAGSCANKIICISDSVRDMSIEHKIFKRDKCLVIHKGSSNGVNLRKFDPDKILENDKIDLKLQLQTNERFIFGFIGRIVDRKGVNELYEAFNFVYEKDNNAALLLVGLPELSQISDNSVLEKLKQHPGIIWPGRTDNVPLYLSIMDVFILPAWWEGFGNVLLESAAMGIPVISTRGTGTRDAVNDGFNGILVDTKNSSQLIEAMNDLKNNPDKRKTMGRNGIEWAKNFENKLIWQGLEKLYQS